MLDRRIDDFSADARLLEAVLGAIGIARRVAALSRAPAHAVLPESEDRLDLFFLGVLSFGRTLEASLSCRTRPLGEEPDDQPRDPERNPHPFSLR